MKFKCHIYPAYLSTSEGSSWKRIAALFQPPSYSVFPLSVLYPAAHKYLYFHVCIYIGKHSKRGRWHTEPLPLIISFVDINRITEISMHLITLIFPSIYDISTVIEYKNILQIINGQNSLSNISSMVHISVLYNLQAKIQEFMTCSFPTNILIRSEFRCLTILD